MVVECVKVMSQHFTIKRPRCRMIKVVMFIDKTRNNWDDVRVQTVGKGRRAG